MCKTQKKEGNQQKSISSICKGSKILKKYLVDFGKKNILMPEGDHPFAILGYTGSPELLNFEFYKFDDQFKITL